MVIRRSTQPLESPSAITSPSRIKLRVNDTAILRRDEVKGAALPAEMHAYPRVVQKGREV